MSEQRFPASVYAHGTDPDVRFSLANERTFLAWIRTALALLALGVGLEALGQGLNPHLRLAAALVLVLAGIAAAAQAWLGWARVERALRQARPLPSSPFSLPLTVAVVAAGVLVLLSAVIR